MARTYELRTRLFVARDLETTFGFFAEAANLQRLTPPWLNFEIVTPQPVPMRRGTLIDYRLTVHGLPVRWRTEITEWQPPHLFVDCQVRGPYKLWLHRHTFAAVDGGTIVEDVVRYRPIGGALIHRLFVQRDLERIFMFRQEQILREFEVPARESPTVEIVPLLV